MRKLAPYLILLLLGIGLWLIASESDSGARRAGEVPPPPAEGGLLAREAREERPSPPATADDAFTWEEERSATAGEVPAGPPIDLEHVFAGEINRRGKPVGYHSRPDGRDPEDARVVRILDGPNGLGVYVARVEIRIEGVRWGEKTSTFFPDALSRGQVVAAIRNAYANREAEAGDRDKFRGPSGLGFAIEGYFQRGRIATAYPIYRQDREGRGR